MPNALETDTLAADFDADFAPVDPGERAIAMLARGKTRRAVADELGVDLAAVHVIVADAVRRRAGEAGTRRGAVAMVHASLDAILDRAWVALDADSGPYDPAPLLEVTLGVSRLRAQLLALEKTARPPRSTADINTNRE